MSTINSLKDAYVTSILIKNLFQPKGFVSEELQGGHSVDHGNVESVRDGGREVVPRPR